MFRATMCPSSGVDDCVMLYSLVLVCSVAAGRSIFVFFISLLIVAQHVSGNHVPIIRGWRLRGVIALYWYVPWLQEGGQDRLAGSASIGRLFGFSYPYWITMHGQPHVRFTLKYSFRNLATFVGGGRNSSLHFTFLIVKLLYIKLLYI